MENKNGGNDNINAKTLKTLVELLLLLDPLTHIFNLCIGSLKLQCALWICTVRAAIFDIYRYITRVKKTNMAALTVHFH